MIQSFQDEFELPNERDPVTPAEENRVLVKCAEEHMLNKKDQKTYRSGVGKLLHMMRWSRPEILNSVRELSRCNVETNEVCSMYTRKRMDP